MNPLYRLFVPKKIEVVLFFSFSALVILIFNTKRLLLLLNGDDPIYVKSSTGAESSINTSLINLQNHINPRFVDFAVWMLVGCLVFILASLIVALIKNANDEAELLHYYKSPKGRRHEANAYLTKVAVRLVGFFGLLIWINIFAGIINPWLIRLFFATITSLGEPTSWLWLVLAVTVMAAGLYMFAILLRLILLKPRVFEVDQE